MARHRFIMPALAGGLLLGSLLGAACGDKDEDTGTGGPADSGADSGSDSGGSDSGGSDSGGSDSGDPGGVPAPFSDCRANDPVGVTDARVVDGALVLDLEFSGGCAEHQHSLCWPDQSFMESFPVQVSLVAWHEDDDDACDAVLFETVSYDLAPLREAYVASYGEGDATIVVHVDGQTVDYSF